MTLRTVRLAACLAVVGASTSMASIVGSSYSFSTSVTGNTQILAVNGNYTDPANPGFCVGPPLACGLGSGLSGSFLFADSTPTTSTIKFTFFGSTSGAGPGSFSINLSNLTGGDPITSITHGSGNLVGGEFTSVTWDGSHAVFTGSTFGDYIALGGAEVIFNVTTVPEPSSVLLIGTAIALLACRRKRRLA
jgi:hypothetical protein